MARKERARSFLFEPGRFKNDEAVRMMSLEARGAYAILFCELWDQPEPGVIPDDARLLASLARATPEEWARHAVAIAAAFDTTSLPGYWVQKGLVETARAQDRYKRGQSLLGKRGANARWNKPEGGDGMAHAAHSDRMAYSGSGSGSGSENLVSEHLLADASANASKPSPNGNSAHRPEPDPPGFADAYAYLPRHVGRRAAAKAYAAALKRHPEIDSEDLINAAKWYAERVEKEAIEERFIPHPATWLNQDRFLEEFADGEAKA